jgi:4-amino-4-deoxy-L-arabinose transferase-like glycosyltransferase
MERMRHPALRRDLLLVVLISGVAALLFLCTQNDLEVNSEDFAWYLNRADLLWRGEFTETSVYTLGYPLLVGLVHLLVPHLFWAALVTNVAVVVALCVGLYVLGLLMFDRQVALAAPVLLFVNSTFVDYVRQMQTFPLFAAWLVWLLVLLRLLALQPRLRWALLLGLGVGLAMYIRFEGLLYAALIPLAAWQMRGVGWRRAVVLAGAALAAAAPLVAAYLWVLARGGLSSGTDTLFAVVAQVGTAQNLLVYLSAAVAGCVDYALRLWPLWVLLPALWALTQARGEMLASSLLLYGLILFHALCLLALVVQPYYTTYYFPLLVLAALPMSQGVVWWAQRIPARAAVPVAVVMAALPLAAGTLTTYLHVPPFDLLRSAPAREAAVVEAWLAARGNPQVYTPCRRLIAYSSAQYRMLYRFGGYHGREDLPDSPPQLFPVLAQTGDLVMNCIESSAIDWNRYFYENRQVPGYTFRLVETLIGETGTAYRFYEVVEALGP